MASIKILLRTAKTLKNGEHPVILRVTHERVSKMFFTGYSSPMNHWNFEKNRYYKSHTLANETNIYLDKFENKARNIAIKFDTIGKPYKAMDIINQLDVKKNRKVCIHTYNLLLMN